ncbi:hypothetical protein EUGRSUZ_H03569 [Eucalyptus grandis]|uniref:Uncharacterized protein n=2 Tax=Eucalyptus grandis TaxID=71139 RepID=A0ACC3JTQ1_EUCGR|nr:hypothetical protein EUGRSUZ_H03569 [Eucalyptus grandis]
MNLEMEQDKSCTVMALLDEGTLKRHRSWSKWQPSGARARCWRSKFFELDTVQILVIDEVDFTFNSSKQVNSLRKLASIPQHKRFLHDCIQQKWTKGEVVHVHVNPIQPMPSCLDHRFVTCHRSWRHRTSLHLLQWDNPESGIIFVGEQSEKSKKAGNVRPTTLLLEFLKNSYGSCSNILLLEEDMNFNARAASLSEVRQKEGCLILATDCRRRY